MRNLEKPKNRTAEALNLMIKSSTFNYYDLGKELNNLNIHKIVSLLSYKYGVAFEKNKKTFVNRFGRKSSLLVLKIKTPKSLMYNIYKKINNK
jgi:hypothetical protein